MLATVGRAGSQGQEDQGRRWGQPEGGPRMPCTQQVLCPWTEAGADEVCDGEGATSTEA